MPPLRPPIIQRMSYPLRIQNSRKPIRRPAVLPRPATGCNMYVALRQLPQHIPIRQIRQIIHRVIEISVVVIHPIHESPNVVHAGKRKTSPHHVRAFKKSIRRVIRPERCPHRRNRNPRLAVVPNKRHHFLAHIRIKLSLHIAPMKWMRALIVKSRPVHRIHAVKFHPPRVDQRLKRPNHSLSLELPLVSRTRRETHQRRTPVPVNHHAHVQPQPVRIPAMIFPFHIAPAPRNAPRSPPPAASARYYTAFA